MEEKKAIAIFGGAFNPPLNSHIYCALQVLKKFSLVKKVVFVPVNSKYNKAGLISNEHRYNMLKLICATNKDLAISRVELDSVRPLYTIETLDYMKSKFPATAICFIIGTDNLKDLSSWKDADRLVSEFKIIVFARYNDNIDEIIKADELLRNNKENFIKIYDNINKDYSSTCVRNMIGKGKKVNPFMPSEILQYIKENRLYL